MNQTSLDLVRIPTKDIFIEDDLDIDVIKTLGLSSQYLENKELLNSVPITVISESAGNYRLINGHEIFHALIKAGKEWAIALRISEGTSPDDPWKYELGLSSPQLNICKLDAEGFESAFEYLQTNIKKLSKISLKFRNFILKKSSRIC